VRVTNTSTEPAKEFRLCLRDIRRWSKRLNEPLNESQSFRPLYLRAPKVLEAERSVSCFVCGSDTVSLRAEGVDERGNRAVSEFFLFSSGDDHNPAGWLVCLEIDICVSTSKRREYVFIHHGNGNMKLANDPRGERQHGVDV
jgi:hypothetical protein